MVEKSKDYERIHSLIQKIFSSAFYEHGAFLVAQTVKHLACNAGDLGSIPVSGRSPEEGNGAAWNLDGIAKLLAAISGLHR